MRGIARSPAGAALMQLHKEHFAPDAVVSRITRRRMARERRGAGSSLVSMETQFYKQYMKDVL